MKDIINNFKGFVTNNKNVIIIVSLVLIAALLVIDYDTKKPTKNYIAFKNDLGIIESVVPTSIDEFLETESKFSIKTNKDVSENELINYLAISPAIEYTIKKESASNYLLIPKNNLPENSIISVDSVREGNTLNRWAFQTEKKLSVLRTYPANESKDVSVKTVIQVSLSHDDVIDFENFVDFDVPGKWENNNGLFTFKPKEKLSYNTVYTMKIKKELSNEEESLEKDFIFSFTTGDVVVYDDNAYYLSSLNIDNSLTFSDDEIPEVPFVYNHYYWYNGESYYKKEKVEVKLYKLNSFNEYVSLSNVYYEINVDNLTLYKNFNTELLDHQNGIVKILFPEVLPIGHYVASYKIGDNPKINQLIQVSNIVAYTGMTERDVLVWTIDKQNNVPLQGAVVNYAGKEIETDKDGLAVISNINNLENDKKHLTISYKEETLVVKTETFDQDNYYDAYIYTDKPLYKETDTINIWGFVPKELFIDGFDNSKLKLIFEKKEYDIKLNSSGIFTTKINFSELSDYGTVSLEYDKINIAYKFFDVVEYEKPKYIYEIITNKNYYNIGEEIKVQVVAKHMSGIPAAQKELVVEYEGEKYNCITDLSGLCALNLIANSYNTYGIFDYSEIELYSKDYQDYNGLKFKTIKILSKDIVVDGNIKFDKNDKYYLEIETNKIDISKGDSYEIYPFDSNVKISVRKKVCSKKDYEYYNPYYKTVVKYRVIDTCENIDGDIISVKTNAGKAIIENLKYETVDNDNQLITYEFTLSANSSFGTTPDSTLYLSDSNNPYKGNDYWHNLYYEGSELNFSYNINGNSSYNSSLNLCAYYPNLKMKYSIDETINTTMKDYEKKDIKDKLYLSYFYKEKIIDYSLNSNEKTFTNTFFPGTNIVGAYFDGEKIIMAESQYLDFNENDRKTEIILKTDKSTYKPKDEVSLNIEVKDKNGNGIESDVIISVVDEAVFQLEDDEIDINNRLFYDKYLPFYQVSSHQLLPYSSNGDGGEGADDGGYRNDFGDTIIFQNIKTDKNGKAKIKFKLNDSLTTFRITAISANPELYSGNTNIKISSKLDFFVETSTMSGVKPSDDFVIPAKSTSINQENVLYQYYLNGKEVGKTEGKTGSYTYYKMPKMNIGKYKIGVIASNEKNSDGVEYDFEIKDNYQKVKIVKEYEIKNNSKISINANKDSVRLLLSDSSLKYYVRLIGALKYSYYQRLDQFVGRYSANEILNKIYLEDNQIEVSIPESFQDGLLKLLPASEKSYVLSALTNKYAKDLYQKEWLDRAVYLAYYEMSKENIAQTRLYEALLFLASNKEPIMGELSILKNNERNYYESIIYALSYAFLGDYSTARSIYKNELSSVKKTNNNYELLTLLNTLIDPDSAKGMIESILKSSNEYRNFAIISYLNNSMPYLEKDNIVYVNDKKITLNKLSAKEIELSKDDLKNVVFKTDSNSIIAEVIYTGSPSELYKEQIVYKVDSRIDSNMSLNNEYSLLVNMQNLEKDSCGTLNITVPNGLRYYGTEKEKFSEIYLIKNDSINMQFIVCSYRDTSKSVKINFLTKNPGNYVFEPVVYENNGLYGVSKSINIQIKE